MKVEELEAELAAKDVSMHEKSLQVDDLELPDEPRPNAEEIDEEKIVMLNCFI